MKVVDKLKFDSLKFLIGVNILFFSLSFLLQILLNQGIDRSALLLLGGFSTNAVNDGMWYLLLTSNFLHIEVFHILINMFSLIQVGRIVRVFYGDRKMFITYIFGGLGAGIFTYFATLGNPTFSVGASGSVLALFGLLIGGTLRKQRYGSGLPIDIKAFLPSLLLLLLLGIINPQINNWAHLGGLIVGISLGFIFSPTLGNIETKKERKLIKWSYLISILLFAFSYIFLVLNFIKEIFFTT